MISKLKARLNVTLVSLLLLATPILIMPTAYAYSDCGSGKTAYHPSLDLGCSGKGNSILDLTFAAIRFLSIGVGLVIVASMVYAGLQYIGARGDPNANAQAIKRIQSNVTALLIFIFAYALINYVVPGQVLK
jgi:hypothetical protein